MATWRYTWTFSIHVDDDKMQHGDQEEIYHDIRTLLDDYSSYAELIGIEIETKTADLNNPDLQ